MMEASVPRAFTAAQSDVASPTISEEDGQVIHSNMKKPYPFFHYKINFHPGALNELILMYFEEWIK